MFTRPAFALVSTALAVHLAAASMPTHAYAAVGLPAVALQMTAADYAKDFSELAKDMREEFRSDNRFGRLGQLVPGCASLLSKYQANTAQSDRLQALRLLAKAIEAEEKKKEEAGKVGNAGLSSVLRYAPLVEKSTTDGFKVGNCGEMSALAFARLYNKYPELELAVVSFDESTGKDHAFVLARLPSGDVYVVDPWKGKSVGPVAFSKGKIYVKGTTNAHPEYGSPIKTTTGWVKKADAGGAAGAAKK